MVSIVLDTVNVIDAESSSLESMTDARAVLGYIVKSSEKIFTDKLLKERLEIDTLQEFKILSNRNFYTKFIKVKTKLYYKQRKFNLFREESEGYAKLITELNQDISGNVTPSNILEIIKSLIGCFNLDPNRVLDVMLDSFEQRPEQVEFFIPLIQQYMPDPKILSEVLAFKFSFYQSDPIPHSLYIVTALMLQYRVIALDDIYTWLSPDDKVITRDWEKEMKDAKEYVRKLNVVSTKTDKEKEEQPEEKEDDSYKYERNQKFGLCEALLEVGDWHTCQVLSRRLPDFCVMDQPPIALAMCRLLHSLIEPVYRKNSGLGPKVTGRVCPPPASRQAPKPANTFLELRSVVIPMLYALGPSLHHDLVLVYKVIRVLKASLEQDNVDAHLPPPTKDSLYHDTISLLDTVILPTLSHLDSNCCVADQIWVLLKLFPYQIRYCLYGRWKNETHLQHAKLLRRRGETLKKIKFIMKRVTKETIKPMGRHIGKLTHYSPGSLFDYMLIQIQTYDNLIVPVVDALKYLTSMSYDVLGYCVVEALVAAERDRFKHDGTSLSLWLQSLATFCGYIFKKYTIELTGLLQYLANQLKLQKSLDLLVLKEVVQKMAGIEAAEEMTKEQLDAMAGGELLKGEAGYFSQVRNTKRSSQRLKDALTVDNLAVTLCLLMAQQRYCVIYRETEKSHLKLVGKLYDQCQDTLVQFGTFLGSTLSVEEYVNKLPSIHSQLAEYHIHMDVAFFLARPMFSHAINQKYDALRKAEPNSKKLSTATKTAKYCEAVAEVMGPVALSVRPLHPPKVWEDISPQFLTTFWSLTMYDLFTPTQAYDREVAKIRQIQATASISKELPASKQKKEVERYTALIEKLQDEKKKQQEHVDRVMARLKQEKDSWFLSRSAKAAKNETITQLLQLCLFPRCVFTTVDALYCAKFVHILHSLQTANFSTLLCYDRLFCDITYSVTSCTENEANRYGRFLCNMLETVMRWHSKKEIFDEECASYPGFVTKFRVSNQFSEANDHVGYENYRHVCHKWHYKITKAILVCLESKDYVQIRNSLIVLIKILPHYPVLAKLSQCIEKKIERIKEDEKNKRQDLFILATSYSGQLKARASFLIREADFHLVNVQPVKTAEAKAEANSQNITANVTTTSAKQVNGELKQVAEKEKPSTTVPDAKKDTSKERRLNRTAPESQSPVKSSETVKKDASVVKPSKDKQEKMREKELQEKEKQLKKEERREEAKKRAEEKMLEEKASPRDRERERSSDKFREERYTEMPLSKDGEMVIRGTYYSAGTSYYPSQDSQLSSVSNSSSGSLRHTPDIDRETKRRKLEASNSSKRPRPGPSLPCSVYQKLEERKVTTSEQPSSTTSLEKRERKEKLKKSVRNPMDEEKELKKERKLSRKRDRLEEGSLTTEQKRRKDEEKGGSSKISSTHQNGDHSDPHMRDKRQFQKEKSPYIRERERSHDREGRDKHRRSGDAKRR
ncbi:THO complex subunit 2 isoform X1 [Homalodisca vitripennis]|uniref:THO complex subunit 2 isoform X1 n=1 Tax=Homalodisca vitripennis TaxID=197043 RepID=UPI001EECEDBC|nr:THO complex subunit 2 isoform X1 [Homalodisca vitripennis]